MLHPSRAAGATAEFLAVNCAALPEPLLESGTVRSRARRVHWRAGTPARDRLTLLPVACSLDEVSESGTVGPGQAAAGAAGAGVHASRWHASREGGHPADNRHQPRPACRRRDFRDDLYYRLQVFGIHARRRCGNAPQDIRRADGAVPRGPRTAIGVSPGGHHGWAKVCRGGTPGGQRAGIAQRARARRGHPREGGLITLTWHWSLWRATTTAATTDVWEMERQLIVGVLATPAATSHARPGSWAVAQAALPPDWVVRNQVIAEFHNFKIHYYRHYCFEGWRW